MFKINSTNVIDKINSVIISRNPCKCFDHMTLEFVELFFAHLKLLELLENMSGILDPDLLTDEMEKLKDSIKENIQQLLEIIEKYSNRKIIVYQINADDSVWEITKNFKSNAAEIYLLNGITKAFSLEDKKILLIPIKY